jgi:hypothetical protein
MKVISWFPQSFLFQIQFVLLRLGLALLALPAAYLPAWLPRTAGIGVTMLAHGGAVQACVCVKLQ